MEDNQFSFWEFISTHIIEIPIIQRDYAQGRKGYEMLRHTFLTQLKTALDTRLEHGRKVLMLDFVYGSEQQIPQTDESDKSKIGTKVLPLDGQQRLTTLWLLHWYIALRSKNLEMGTSKLKHFTYETRISSREFCENLCQTGLFEGFCPDKQNVANYIKGQIWFFAEWEHDPTISAMLLMLTGTETSPDNPAYPDGIEKLFAGVDEKQFATYWEKLTKEDAPIQFYYQPLKNFGLTDDLYIKMNARGKQLTPYENFKADLVGYINDSAERDEKWERLIDPKKGIAIKLDTVWTDLFWNHRSEDYKIDDIYFAFLNRFFWNYMVRKGKGKELPNSPYYKCVSEEDLTAYRGIELYRFHEKEIPLELFEDLCIVLDNYTDYVKKYRLPSVKWQDTSFTFIPRYIEKTKVPQLTLTQRVIFYAFCKYFAEGPGDEKSFSRWMRVVCNIISGRDETWQLHVRNQEAVWSVIDKLDTLNSHDIYQSLAHATEPTNDTAIDNRLKEEIIKARQILDGNYSLRPYNTSGLTWEDVIIQAEEYSFFHGTIRFLFQNETGSTDWTRFDEKFTNCQNYFKKEANYRAEDSVMNPDFDNASLLKALISRFTAQDHWDVLYWNHRVFNNRPGTWIYYLTNTNIYYSVHHILLGERNILSIKHKMDDEATHILYLLSQTGLLDFVLKELPDSWIRLYHHHYAIYPSATGVFLNADKRNDFLLHTPGVKVNDNAIIKDCNLLYGTDIKFKYNKKDFLWNEEDKVYLMDGDCAKKKSENEYYFFDASGDKNYEDIISELERLSNMTQCS